jgi:hypothetical protein
MDIEPFEVKRSALIAIAKQPFVDWLHRIDPTSTDIDLSQINREPTVYLIPEFEIAEEFSEWLEHHCELIFEEQLNGWWTDKRSWPPNRSIKVFREWFDSHWHSEVLDLDDQLL